MNITIKYPSRSRPELFKSRILDWTSKASGQHEIVFVCSFDTDDPTMNTPEMRAWCTEHGLNFFYGQSKTKVEACNADLEHIPANAQIIILLSDDMVCQIQNWDLQVVADFVGDFDRGLFYHDGTQDRTITFTVVGRPVLETLLGGYLYHPQFRSVYCDNYLTDILEKHNKLTRIPKAQTIVKHEWRKQNNDALMARNEERTSYKRDRQTYEELRQQLCPR